MTMANLLSTDVVVSILVSVYRHGYTYSTLIHDYNIMYCILHIHCYIRQTQRVPFHTASHIYP